MAAVAGLCLLISQPAPARGAEEFVVVEEAVTITERGKVSAYCILSEGHRFSFIPPLHWRMESNRSEKSVTFTRRGLNTVIRIRLLPAETTVREKEEERWLELVRARYPEAEVIRRFVCPTGSQPGVAFDLRQDSGGNLKLESRVTFVPYDQGVIEISQTGFYAQAEPSYEDFGMVLTSLRVKAQTPLK